MILGALVVLATTSVNPGIAVSGMLSFAKFAVSIPRTSTLSKKTDVPTPFTCSNPPDEISLFTKRRLFKDISSNTFGILFSDASNPFMTDDDISFTLYFAVSTPFTVKPPTIVDVPAPFTYNSPPDEISLVTKRRLPIVISSFTFVILLIAVFNPYTAFIGIESLLYWPTIKPSTVKLLFIRESPTDAFTNNRPPDEISPFTNRRLFKDTSSVILGALVVLATTSVNPGIARSGMLSFAKFAVRFPHISTLSKKTDLPTPFTFNNPFVEISFNTVKLLIFAEFSMTILPFTDRSSVTITTYSFVVVRIIAESVYCLTINLPFTVKSLFI